MKPAFITDVQEISTTAYRVFISTFDYRSGSDSDSDSDSDFESTCSESDLSDWDPGILGCGEITPEVENMVEESWKLCDPLEDVYGPVASGIIKEGVITAKEETQCAGINVFTELLEGAEDQNLIATCTAVAYWCCCESIKKVSPIISEALMNLMY